MRSRVASLSWLWLMLAPLVAQAAPSEADARLPVLAPIRASVHRDETGEGLRLSFANPGPHSIALSLFTRDDAREVVSALEGRYKAAGSMTEPRSLSAVTLDRLTAGMISGSAPGTHLSELERCVRAEDEALFGSALLPLPGPLEHARWFRALKLSPRYMEAGIREAAMELLLSPAVAFSVGTSMVLYLMAWAAPEPLFSKAFATAVTLGLLMTYTAAELYNVGNACLTLYRDAEASRTQAQLEAAAERFGKAMGAVGLRVLVTVAGAKLAKGLPEGNRGGLWNRWSPERSAFPGGQGGMSIGAGARAHVNVANGTVVLMGVSANTAASALASARVGGACAESKKDDNHAHHLCTNKNEKSESSGGPWTPAFEELFDLAGMSLEDPSNIVYLRDHKGPHPKEYHSEVFKRLRDALKGCRSQASCRAKLVRALDELAGEVCSSGSFLNKLATRTP